MAFTDNFETLTSEFKSSTGLDWKTNIDTYIQYFQARMLDRLIQQQNEKMDALIQEVRNRL